MRRVIKRRNFRVTSRESLKQMRNFHIQHGLSLAEIRCKFKESRRVRKSGAFNPPHLKEGKKLTDLSANGEIAKERSIKDPFCCQGVFQCEKLYGGCYI